MRWGIRARLLLLLIPGIAIALALDSCTDHRVRYAAISEALDEVLLQPLAVLDQSVQADARGGLRLEPPPEVRAMFDALPARHKFLFAGARVQGSQEGRTVLLGNEPLPAPPPGLAPTQALPNLLTTPDTHVYLYDAQYHGQPVRVALLERSVLDAAGRAHQFQVQVAETTARREQARRESLQRELWQNGRTLLIAAVLLALGVSWSLRPLARLRDRIRAQPAGEPAPLDPAEVPHEVAPLVDAVNLSIERYRAVLQEQERFLADAAHQLRTPLAVMMAQLGYAQRAQEPAAAAEAMEALSRQLQRSRRIADQLLAMSHAVSGDAAPPPVTDLNAVAREAVLDALPMAQALGLDLGCAADDGDTPLPVLAPPQEIGEILGNLIHNALRHAPRGGTVTVSAGRDAAAGFVDVVDNGPGIAPERREAVFERFHSRSQAATQGPAGAGLGLAIARAYARKRGGDVTLHDAPQGTGLRARLRLPMARQAR
jgi:two-component system sensor histidine kinase TctE